MTDQDGGSGLGKIIEKAQEMVGAAVGMTSASTLGATSTDAFVTNAAVSDLFEIEASRLALQRARSPQVRLLADVLIRDHTRSSTLMKRKIASAGLDVSLPQALDQRRQGLLDHLDHADEGDFDKLFLRQQQMAHQEAIALFKGYADHGDVGPLRGLAAQTLPTLEQHLRLAKQDAEALDGAQAG